MAEPQNRLKVGTDKPNLKVKMQSVCLGTCNTKYEIHSFNRYGAISQKSGGHMTLVTFCLFQNILRGHVQTVPGNMQVKFLKSVALTV